MVRPDETKARTLANSGFGFTSFHVNLRHLAVLGKQVPQLGFGHTLWQTTKEDLQKHVISTCKLSTFVKNNQRESVCQNFEFRCVNSVS